MNILALLYVLSAQAYSSQPQPKELSAVKVNNPPVINGTLDDLCWKVAAQATGFEDTLLGQLTPDQTVAFLAYDDNNIYVAFHCYDSQPDKIVARETKDQSRPSGEDMVAFSIDTFHNHKFADRSFFIVNPLGTKFAQIGGGRAQKTEWTGLWEAKARIVRDGWIAETRIPWEMLNYPSSKQAVTLGINFDRRQQRTGVHSWWSNIGPQEFYEKDGHWVGVELPPKSKNLSLLPFGYFSMKRGSKRSMNSQLGLDMKYPLTSGLTFVGTINPDFSNIEQSMEN